MENECRPEALVEAQRKRSSAERRQYLRSVFETHVRSGYGNSNLAKAFLRHPDADPPAIVEAWAEYKNDQDPIVEVLSPTAFEDVW